MECIRNLICLEDDIVSVIRFRSEELEFVKKDGETEFPVTDDFWTWWKGVVSYIEGDPVDICFVYDKEYALLQENEIIDNNIINTENSVWKINHIKQYFWNLKPTYFSLNIIGLRQQKYSINDSGTGIPRQFCTNLDFDTNTKSIKSKNKDKEYKAENVSEVKTIDDEEYSDFAKYFIDLIRRERG